MNTDEFNTWISAHRVAFPEVKLWFADNEDPKAAMAMWRDILSSVSLENASRVTRRMLAGEIEHPDRWNISRLPGAVLANSPRPLPTIEELNDPKTGWTGNGGYRAK